MKNSSGVFCGETEMSNAELDGEKMVSRCKGIGFGMLASESKVVDNLSGNLLGLVRDSEGDDGCEGGGKGLTDN